MKEPNSIAVIVNILMIGMKRIGKVNYLCANAPFTKMGNIASSCQTPNVATSNIGLKRNDLWQRKGRK